MNYSINLSASIAILINDDISFDIFKDSKIYNCLDILVVFKKDSGKIQMSFALDFSEW